MKLKIKVAVIMSSLGGPIAHNTGCDGRVWSTGVVMAVRRKMKYSEGLDRSSNTFIETTVPTRD
jgi:hypothetical protein